MKVRSGFVSNSSSSSFVIISPVSFDPFEVFTDADEKEFMKQNISRRMETVLGQPAFVYELRSGDEGCYEITQSDGFEELVKLKEEDEWEYGDFLFNRLVGAFQDNKECFVAEDYS